MQINTRRNPSDGFRTDDHITPTHLHPPYIAQKQAATGQSCPVIRDAKGVGSLRVYAALPAAGVNAVPSR